MARNCRSYSLLRPYCACAERERVTHTCETFLDAISQDLGECLNNVFDLQETLRAVAALFALNEMELAAWYCCLREIPAMGLDYQQVSLLLWLAAFHVKTALGESPEQTVQRLRNGDPDVAYHMKEWRAVHGHFHPFSLPQINDSYRRLVRLTQKVEVMQSMNDRVDELVVSGLQVPIAAQETEDSSDSGAEVFMECQDFASGEFVWPYEQSLQSDREWANVLSCSRGS